MLEGQWKGTAEPCGRPSPFTLLYVQPANHEGKQKKYLEMYCFIFGWGDFHESSFSRKKHTQKTAFYQTPQIHCGHRFQVTGDFWAALGDKIVCCAVTFK